MVAILSRHILYGLLFQGSLTFVGACCIIIPVVYYNPLRTKLGYPVVCGLLLTDALCGLAAAIAGQMNTMMHET